MSKPSVSFLFLALLGCAAFAYDSDPGYGVRGDSSSVRVKDRSATPNYYYKPTMRYFGKGYMVAYGYVQSNKRMNQFGATVVDGANYILPAKSVQTLSPGTLPRVTYYYGTQTNALAPASPVKQGQQSVGTSPAKSVPPIAEDASKKR